MSLVLSFGLNTSNSLDGLRVAKLGWLTFSLFAPEGSLFLVELFPERRVVEMSSTFSLARCGLVEVNRKGLVEDTW